MEQGEGNLQRLLKWASEIGISDSTSCQASCLGHSLAVSFFPDSGGRGLGAARDLTEGELILKVPKSALMTSTSLSLKDDKLSLALNAHHSLSPTQILAVCLLYEMGKGKSSWWHPYLMNLPRSYDILATFGEFEKQALQVDDAIWAAEKATLKAEDDWKEANALMEQLKLKPQLRTFRAWLWASATISSRTLHIPWDAAGCLCPVGDLFNYSAPGEEPSGCESMEHATHDLVNDDSSGTLDVDVSDSRRLTDGGFEKDIDAYCFYAKKSYKKGEQALLSYGTYTNLELLEHYGFLLNGNPNDKVFFPLEPEIYSSCSWPKESLYIHQSGKPSFALLSALRLWATPQNQRRSVGHLVYSGLQLSIQNEMYVMTWMSKKCITILKSLPTSFEDDRLLSSAIDEIQNLESPLELNQLSSTCRDEICAFKSNLVQKGERSSMQSRERWRLAVEWRLSYKKILVDCISYCDETLNRVTGHTVELCMVRYKIGMCPSCFSFVSVVQAELVNDLTIYEGNPGLCGLPLATQCLSGSNNKDRKVEDGGEGNGNMGLYISTTFGFIVELWVVLVSLVIKRSWRRFYFEFLGKMKESLVLVTTWKCLACSGRKSQLERQQ